MCISNYYAAQTLKYKWGICFLRALRMMPLKNLLTLTITNNSKYFSQCPKHNEKICYFSNTQKHVICTSCVCEKPLESRKACMDLDVAYNQNLKKLDRALLVSALNLRGPWILVNSKILFVPVSVRHAEYNSRRRGRLPYVVGGIATEHRHGEIDHTQFCASPSRCHQQNTNRHALRSPTVILKSIKLQPSYNNAYALHRMNSRYKG